MPRLVELQPLVETGDNLFIEKVGGIVDNLRSVEIFVKMSQVENCVL
jgi:hypothetical protein